MSKTKDNGEFLEFCDISKKLIFMRREQTNKEDGENLNQKILTLLSDMKMTNLIANKDFLYKTLYAADISHFNGNL